MLPFRRQALGTGFVTDVTKLACRIALRTAYATRLANAGCTPEQIKAITGHKTLSEVARYTKAADQERNAKQALANLLRSESEQACPTPPTSWSKSENNPTKSIDILEDGAPERIRTSDP